MTDPVLTAALSQPIVGMFVGLRMDLTATPVGRVVCLLDGAGQIQHGADLYKGIDDDFGTIDTVESISDGSTDQAPEIIVSLLPNSAASSTNIANPQMQNCPVKIIVGSFNTVTGIVIGEPEVKFLGMIDVPTLIIEKSSRKVEISIVSIFERLFEVDDAVRASDGYHQSLWPGEKGLEFMTGTDKNLYWGGKAPVNTYTSRVDNTVDYNTY